MAREIGPISQADAERFKAKLGEPTWEEGCIPWLGRRDYLGYGVLGFNLNKAKNILAHRMAYQLAKGPTNLDVLHSCDNPWCCNPDHLRAGTAQENAADKVNRGRGDLSHKGERNGSASITTAQALEIIRLHKEGLSPGEITVQMEVTYSVVWKIVSGKSWPHLPR